MTRSRIASNSRAELVDLLGREPRQRALDRGCLLGAWLRWLIVIPLGWLKVRSRSAPSGALTQVRTISPSLPWTSPVRRSRTWPRAELADAGVADAHPAAEGQGGAGLLAGDEDRRAAVAARPRPGSWRSGSSPPSPPPASPPITGWKRSISSSSGSPSRSQCSVSASSISPGPEAKAWRSRQSGQSSSRSAGATRPCSPVICRCRSIADVGAWNRARAGARRR